MIHVELLLWQGLSTLNINNLIHYCSVAVSVFSLCFTSPFSIRSGISTVSQGPSWSGGKEGEEEEEGGGGGGRGGGGRGGGGRGGGRGKTVQNQTNSKPLPIDNMCELLTTPLNEKNDEQPPDCCASRHTHLSWFVTRVCISQFCTVFNYTFHTWYVWYSPPLARDI